MFVVICYDIVEDRRRTKVMKHLKGVGFHAQKSVFECFLDQKRIDKLIKRLRHFINEEEDSLRIYILPEHFCEQTLIVGRGEKNTLPRLILL